MSLDISTLRQRLQQALGNEFTVGDLLGEGGFAAVFRAREHRPRRDVAVKVVDLGLTPSPSLAVRFVREARTVARLEHPHIVPIYKVGGYQNEVLYIVMRCVDGPSPRQLLEKERRLSGRTGATCPRRSPRWSLACSRRTERSGIRRRRRRARPSSRRFPRPPERRCRCAAASRRA